VCIHEDQRVSVREVGEFLTWRHWRFPSATCLRAWSIRFWRWP